LLTHPLFLIVPKRPQPKPRRAYGPADDSIFGRTREFDLDWDELNRSWTNFFGTDETKRPDVPRKCLVDGIKDCAKYCDAKSVPKSDLYQWHIRFRVWLGMWEDENTKRKAAENAGISFEGEDRFCRLSF